MHSTKAMLSRHAKLDCVNFLAHHALSNTRTAHIMPCVLYYSHLSAKPLCNILRYLTCFPLLGLDLWLNVDQQGVQWEAVGEDKVANIVATDTQ